MAAYLERQTIRQRVNYKFAFYRCPGTYASFINILMIKKSFAQFIKLEYVSG